MYVWKAADPITPALSPPPSVMEILGEDDGYRIGGPTYAVHLGSHGVLTTGSAV